MRTLIVLIACLACHWAFAAPTPAEQAWSVEFRKAVGAKDTARIAALVQGLAGEGFGVEFKLQHCRQLLGGAMDEQLNGAIFEAAAVIMAAETRRATAGGPGAEPAVARKIATIMALALDKVNRNAPKFTAILAYYREAPDPAALPNLKKYIQRFQEDAAILAVVFATLANIRDRESVSIINDIYYRAWKKIEDEQGTSAKVQKLLNFYLKIKPDAVKALNSLTGQDAAEPRVFNDWWTSNRGKFQVQSKPVEVPVAPVPPAAAETPAAPEAAPDAAPEAGADQIAPPAAGGDTGAAPETAPPPAGEPPAGEGADQAGTTQP
ncbi:MAG: hypothetical protein ABIF71_06050 [Planctomycetota bacterium]